MRSNKLQTKQIEQIRLATFSQIRIQTLNFLKKFVLMSAHFSYIFLFLSSSRCQIRKVARAPLSIDCSIEEATIDELWPKFAVMDCRGPANNKFMTRRGAAMFSRMTALSRGDFFYDFGCGGGSHQYR